MIEKLDWDSEFFGYNVGKIDINEQFDEDEFIKLSNEYKLIYCFAKSKIKSTKLNLVDEKTVLSQIISLDRFKNAYTKYQIVSFDKKQNNSDQLIKLALSSGKYSRFHIDKNFNNNEYERLYLEWIEKSMNKELAFDILVALDNDNIIGFTTLGKKNNELADIGLVAVDENYRGKGLAYGLLQKSIESAKANGFEKIQVVTQLNNIPAVRLYEKANFKIKDITYIYHYWNYDSI